MILPNPLHAAEAAKRVATAFAQGEPILVSRQTEVLREAACKQCPRRDPAANQCLECSCFLALKVQLATEKCPLGKWPVTNAS